MAGDIVFGGSYAIEREGPFPVPVFRFRVEDIASFRVLTEHQEVTFEVRHAPDGSKRLAYTLVLPHLGLAPAAIPIEPKDMLHVATGYLVRNGTIGTVVDDDHGGELSFDDAAHRLYLDWAGDYAEARAAYDLAMRGMDREANLEHAARVIRRHHSDLESNVVAAYELFGAILVAQGRTGEALNRFLKAIEMGRRSPVAGETALHTRAATPLASLGASYETLGMKDEARICLDHALHLRPNHPSALLGLARIATEPHVVAHALARVARIGGRHADLEATARQLSRSSSPSADQLGADLLVAEAERDAATLDLGTWPYAREELADHDHFLRELLGPEAVGDYGISDPDPEPAPEPAGYRDAPNTTGAAAPSEPAQATEPPQKPWWKLW